MKPDNIGSLLKKQTLSLCGIALAVVFAIACVLQVKAAQNKATVNIPKTAANAAAPAPNQDPTKASKPPIQIFSQFTTNDARDPFHPKLKINKSSGGEGQQAAPTVEPNQILTALQNGFEGTLGTADERVAFINGAALQNQREYNLNLNVGGTPRRVKVKTLKILRNAVELQVEGIQQPVTIAKRQR